MAAPGVPQIRTFAARNIAGSGAVLGIAGGLLLWLMGYVGPVYFLVFVVIFAIGGALLFGLPALLYERKVMRERKEAQEEAAARAAADAAIAARVRQSGQPYPGYGAGYAGAPSWTPMAGPRDGAAAPSAASAGAAPAAKPAQVVPVWPLDEPLCVLETRQESDAWSALRALNLPPDRVLGFTTMPVEEITQAFGVARSSLYKITRIEGEGNVDPGDLEKIGNLIERHLGGAERRVVVLPSVENLVEAGNVRNVRRLLEVVRDLAQGSKGSMLVALDPVSLPEAQVVLLERGTHKLPSA